jgi:hypothetical protein
VVVESIEELIKPNPEEGFLRFYGAHIAVDSFVRVQFRDVDSGDEGGRGGAGRATRQGVIPRARSVANVSGRKRNRGDDDGIAGGVGVDASTAAKERSGSVNTAIAASATAAAAAGVDTGGAAAVGVVTADSSDAAPTTASSSSSSSSSGGNGDNPSIAAPSLPSPHEMAPLTDAEAAATGSLCIDAKPLLRLPPASASATAAATADASASSNNADALSAAVLSQALATALQRSAQPSFVGAVSDVAALEIHVRRCDTGVDARIFIDDLRRGRVMLTEL